MNKFLLLIIFLMTISCAGTTVSNTKSPATGWNDEDTYTVQVTAKDKDEAVKAAKHKILKDIVDVRVRNNSRYTDIIKIRDEFDMPLKNGKIIVQLNTADGIMIYYQIRDKGLKKKFQRQ